MPEIVTLKIRGAKELETALKEFGPKFTNRLGNKALKAGAQPIVDEAKRRVPVRTTELRESIVAVVARTRNPAQKKVKIGFKRPTSRRAHLTEFGTVHHPAQPFLRPALDSQAQPAIDKITDTLRKGLNDQASFTKTSTFVTLVEGFSEEIEI